MRIHNDPNLYGRIPNPPEHNECCGNCKYNTRERKIPFHVEKRTGNTTEIIQVMRITAKNGRARMAHIKCRYDEVYCGYNGKWGISGEPCYKNIDTCESGLSYDYDEWNIPICEAAYLVECEFEKTVKQYEYISETGFNQHLAELHIGKRVYDRISYLEIDGRVLIGKEDKTE